VGKSLKQHCSVVNKPKEFTITRNAKNEDSELVNINIPLAINYTKTGKILINSPGLGGLKDGDNGIFLKIAKTLQVKNVASVVRYESSLFDFAFKKVSMEQLLMDNLRTVINYALENAKEICGSDQPELFLAGYSAGASTTAAISAEFKQTTKMLLIAPSIDIDLATVEKSLSEYTSELYMISGDKDYVINPQALNTIGQWAKNTKHKKIITITNCDHDFSGKQNKQNFAQAYLWAFGDGKNSP
jgi:hypothetical protein